MHDDYIKILAMFANQFSPTVWQQVQVLVTGTILAQGQRTVALALRPIAFVMHTQYPEWPGDAHQYADVHQSSF